jgi:nucleotide-binding universal stress UspA family protein
MMRIVENGCSTDSAITLVVYRVQLEKVHLRGRVDEVILSYIREHEIDLLVMGAYGRRSVSEFVFGSVTKSLVAQAGIPLFIYH